MIGRKDSGRAASSGDLSIIARDVTITGNIGGNGKLHIDGRVEGDVACAAITLGSNGTVVGHVTAEQAVIAGTIDGTVTAATMTVEASARIAGDLSYETVSIANGAVVDGRVRRMANDGAAGLKLVASE